MKKEKSASQEKEARERRKIDAKKFLVDMVFIVAGCALGGFATIGIMIPNGLSAGGVTGICRVLQRFVDLDYSIMYYIGSFVILIICWITLGFKEARKIMLLSVLYPLTLVLLEQSNFTLLEEKDMILAAIYCGVFNGISVGLFFTRGYSSGGMDTVARILKAKVFPGVSASKVLLGLDAIVIIASGISYGRNVALYALVTQVISTRLIEVIMYGFESKIVKLEIITRGHKDEIAEYIMKEMDRGVSTEEVVGEYTGESRSKLSTYCTPRESMLIKNFIAKADQRAFVTVTKVETVWGKGAGFSDLESKE